MSKKVDKRVVQMTFDNKNFEKNVQKSMDTIQRLKESLNFKALNPFKNLGKSVKDIKLDGLNKGLEVTSTKIDNFSVKAVAKFKLIDSALGLVGRTARGLVSKLALPFQIIEEKGKIRAQNIAQAKFQLEGLGIAWEKVGDDINYAVDGTAYGLDSAARAAAQLSASNVQLGDDMKAALRGISGVAAMTNAEYDDIARIFTAVAGSGRLMASELNRIADRGLNATAALASYLHATESEVKEMVRKGQVDFQTFADAMDNAFGSHAKDANKTFTGALSNVKAALGRIGAEFATPTYEKMIDVLNSLRNNINSVKKSLAPVVKEYKIVLNQVQHALLRFLNNPYLRMTADNIAVIFANLAKTIRHTFMQLNGVWEKVFPVSLTETIAYITFLIRKATEQLTVNEGVVSFLRGLIEGIAWSLRIIMTVIENVIRLLAPLASLLGNIQLKGGKIAGILLVVLVLGRKMTGVLALIIKSLAVIKIVALIAGIAALVTGIAALVKKIVTLITTSQKLRITLSYVRAGFETVRRYVILAGEAIKNVALLVAGLIYQFAQLSPVHTVLNAIKTALGFIVEHVSNLKNIRISSFSDILEGIKNGLAGIGNWFKNVPAFQKVIRVLTNTFDKLKSIGIKVKDVFGKMTGGIKNFSTALKKAKTATGEGTQQLGLFGIILNKIKEAFEGKSFIDIATEALYKFKDALIAARNWMTPTKAAIIVFTLIFVSLAASVKTASDGFAMATKAFAGVAGSISGTFGTLKTAIKNFGNKHDTIKQLAMLVAAIAAALAVLSNIPEKDLYRSATVLGVLTIVIGTLAIIATQVGKVQKDMSLVQFSMGQMMIGIFSLVAALKVLNTMTMDKSMIGKVAVLVAIVTALGALSIAISKFSGDKKMTVSALGMIGFGVAIKKTAEAMKVLNDVDFGSLKKNIETIAAILVSFAILAAGMGQIRASSVVGILLMSVMIDKIVESLQNIADHTGAFDVLAERFRAFGASIKNMMTQYQSGIKIITEVPGFISQQVEATINPMVAGVLAIGAGALMLSKLLTSIGVLMKGIGRALFGIAASVALFAIIFERFNNIEIKDSTITNWSIFMLSVLGVLVGVFAAMGHFKIAENGNKAAATMIALGVSMLLMVGAFKSIVKAVTEGMATQEGANGIVMATFIIGLLITLVGAATALANSGKGNAKLGPVIAMLTGVSILIFELSILAYAAQEAGTGNMIVSIAGIVGVLLAVSLLMKTVNDMKVVKNVNKVKMLVASILLIATVGATLIILAHMNWIRVLSSMAAISLTLLSVTHLLDVISGGSGLGNDKTWKKKIAMLITVSGMLVALGVSLMLVATQNWTSILSATAPMVGVILSLSYGLFPALNKLKTGNDWLKKIAMIAAVSGSLVLIGVSLMLVAKQDWKSILAATVPMVACLWSIGGVLTLIGKFGDWKGTLAAMAAFIGIGASLLIIAHAFEKFAEIDWANIDKQIYIFLGVMAGVTLVFGIISAIPAIGQAFALGLLAFGAAMIMVGGALMLAAKGFQIAVNALQLLGPALQKTGEGIQAGLEAIAIGMAPFTEAMDRFSQLDLRYIAENILTIAAGIVVLSLAGLGMIAAGAGLVLAGAGLEKIAPALALLAQYNMEGMGQQLYEIAESMTRMALAGVALIAGAVGILAVTVLLPAFGDAAIYAGTAVNKAATMIGNGIAYIQAALSVNMRQAGVDAVNGIADGMSDSGAMSNLANAVKNVAGWDHHNGIGILGMFGALVGWGSSWKTTIEAGIDFVGGLKDGLFKGDWSGVKSSLSSLLEGSVFSTLQNAGTRIAQWAGNIGNTIKNVVSGIASGNGIIASLSNIGKVYDPLMNNGKGGYRDKINGSGGIIQEFKDLAKQFANTSSVGETLKDTLGDITTGLDDTAIAAGGGTGASGGGGASGALSNVGTAMDNLSNYSMPDLTSSLSNQNTELDKANSKWEKLEAKLQAIKDKGQAAADAITSLGQALFKYNMDNDPFAEQKEREKTMKEYEDEEADLQRQLEEIYAKRASSRYAQDFSSEIEEIKGKLEEVRKKRQEYDEEQQKKKEEETSTLAERNAKLSANINDSKEIDERIANIRRSGASKKVIQYIRDEVQNGNRAILEEFENASEAEIKEFNRLYKENLKISEETATNVVKLYDKAGVNAAKAFCKRLKKAKKQAKKAGKEFAMAAYTGLAEALGIHSPSRKAIWLADMVTKGFVNETKANTPEAVKASTEAMGATLSAMKKEILNNHINGTSDYAEAVLAAIGQSDLNPVITPILDLSQLEQGLAYTNSLFNGSYIPVYGQMYGQPVNDSQNESKISETSMDELADKVVNAINSRLQPEEVMMKVNVNRSGLFDFVREENNYRTTRTGYNQLARVAQAT